MKNKVKNTEYAPMNDFGKILENKTYKTISDAYSNLNAEYNKVTIIFKNKVYR